MHRRQTVFVAAGASGGWPRAGTRGTIRSRSIANDRGSPSNASDGGRSQDH